MKIKNVVKTFLVFLILMGWLGLIFPISTAFGLSNIQLCLLGVWGSVYGVLTVIYCGVYNYWLVSDVKEVKEKK